MNFVNQPQDIDKYANMLIRYKARQLVQKFAFPRSDREDLEQEMKLDLLERLQHFDPTKASRNTFIARIVNRKVVSIIRHETAERRDCRREEGSLDAVRETEDSTQDLLDIDSDEYDLRMGRRNLSQQDETDLGLDMAQILKRLPGRLREFCERLKNESVADIVRELGVPRSTFYDEVIRPLRVTFENAGMRNYL